MTALHVKQWKAQLAAARKLQRQWLKAYKQAERALLRVGKKIDQLEKKIDAQLANT